MSGQSLDQSVQAFLAYVRIECGLSKNTQLAYARDLRDMLATLHEQGAQGVADVSPQRLVAHVQSLRSGRELSATSVARHLATIRMFFRWLVTNGKIEENPADWLERPSTWMRLPGVISERQMRTLLEAPQPPDPPNAPGHALYLRDRAMLETMYACGLRASEVASLALDDFLPTLGVVRVTGKGDKQRLVPFNPEAERRIETWLRDGRPAIAREDGRDKQRLFISRTGRPLERVAVWTIVKRHASSVGLPAVYPHLFRHSFATHLLSGGADLRIVQELLGHANVTTTQVYTRVDQPRLKKIHAQFHPRA
ncbi:MAG: tyrosine recombinase [Planctomycetota bacterium]